MNQPMYMRMAYILDENGDTCGFVKHAHSSASICRLDFSWVNPMTANLYKALVAVYGIYYHDNEAMTQGHVVIPLFDGEIRNKKGFVISQANAIRRRLEASAMDEVVRRAMTALCFTEDRTAVLTSIGRLLQTLHKNPAAFAQAIEEVDSTVPEDFALLVGTLSYPDMAHVVGAKITSI